MSRALELARMLVAHGWTLAPGTTFPTDAEHRQHQPRTCVVCGAVVAPDRIGVECHACTLARVDAAGNDEPVGPLLLRDAGRHQRRRRAPKSHAPRATQGVAL